MNKFGFHKSNIRPLRNSLKYKENWLFVLSTLILCSVFLSPCQAQVRKDRAISKQSLSARQIAEKILPSVVLVISECPEGKVIFGSGFFVGQGLIATNKHVVQCGTTGFISLIKQKEKHPILSKWISPDKDLALLKVQGIEAKALSLSDDKHLSIGDTVYAAGNPKGLEGTFSNGIVSSLRDDAGLIQFTAPISQGSSGGPVVDEYSEVIGVTVSYFANGQNLNFAVPTSELKKLISQVSRGEVSEATLESKSSTASGSSSKVVEKSRSKDEGMIYGLVLNSSNTLPQSFKDLKETAREIVLGDAAKDEPLVMRFRLGSPHIHQWFTDDQHKLLQAIDDVDNGRPGQPVVDAVYLALKEVSSYSKKVSSPAAIIVLTDELGRGDLYTWEDLLVSAQTNKIPVYFIVYPSSTDYNEISDPVQRANVLMQSQQRIERGEKFMKLISQESGGQVLFYDSQVGAKSTAKGLIQLLHPVKR